MRLTTLALTHEAAVATVTLQRPELRNAFDSRSIAEIDMVFTQLGQEGKVRAIVLAAQGTAFCAGVDLNWRRDIAGYSDAENLADAARLAAMLSTIYRCPKPVVARVQGDVYAGGVGLVAACDIAVSVDTAQFCFSEVRLGLIPATISPYVIRAMGENAARRYFLTGERFSAQNARSMGLLHEVVAPEALDAAVGALTAALTAASPHAVREAKRLVRDIGGAPIDTALIAETATRIAAIRASAEGQEGVRAFLDKRRPSWLLPKVQA
ncbi:MAG: enoyl-CoA hydratase/isomerase family protein [Burkholderiaceae bacterium]